jgi:hypothetical protein
MWDDLLAALALVFVIEGLLPFVSPAALRKTLVTVSQMSDNALRFTGLTSMLLGLLVLQLVRG